VKSLISLERGNYRLGIHILAGQQSNNPKKKNWTGCTGFTGLQKRDLRKKSRSPVERAMIFLYLHPVNPVKNSPFPFLKLSLLP